MPIIREWGQSPSTVEQTVNTTSLSGVGEWGQSPSTVEQTVNTTSLSGVGEGGRVSQHC